MLSVPAMSALVSEVAAAIVGAADTLRSQERTGEQSDGGLVKTIWNTVNAMYSSKIKLKLKDSFLVARCLLCVSGKEGEGWLLGIMPRKNIWR